MGQPSTAHNSLVFAAIATWPDHRAMSPASVDSSLPLLPDRHVSPPPLGESVAM
jgi:hypothetical protein